MDKRKVIIIGATSGLGRALARIYIRAGWTTGITGRRKELLSSLKDEFTSSGIQKSSSVFSACFDVRSNENIAQVESLIKDMGGLDLIIYNSGYGEVSETMNWEIDKRIIDINVRGFTEIVNWTFNYFSRQGHGHIAATSSIGSNRGTSYAPAYSASKAFMSNYMEGLYMKSSKQDLKINITDIQPGFLNSKPAPGNKRFWVIDVDKAAKQIFRAIERKKFRVYISKRWEIIARIIRIFPLSIYKRFG